MLRLGSRTMPRYGRMVVPGRTIIGELRLAWLRLTFWQLLAAVCAFANAGVIHKPISVLFALVGLFALRSVLGSFGIWRNSR